MNKRLKYLLLGMMAVGICMALFIGWQRSEVEQGNKSVEVAAEWGQVKEMAQRENLSEEEVLKQLKGKITGVIFKEPTLSDLKAEGIVLIKTGTEMGWELQLANGIRRLPVQNDDAGKIRTGWNYLIFSDSASMARVSQNLELKTGPGHNQFVRYYLQTPEGVLPVLGTSLSMQDMSGIGLGFDQKAFKLVSSLGLHIIPQIRSWRTVTDEGLNLVFDQFQDLPVSSVFFNDHDLPGVGLAAAKQNMVFSGLAHRIDSLGVPVGMVEFFPQKGLTPVAKFMNKKVVRLHSIRENELSTMTQSKAVDRYTLAVTERDMRVLLIRFFPDMGLHDTNVYLDQIKTSLEDKGFSLGKPESFGSLPFSRLYLLLIALAVMAGGIMLFTILGGEKIGWILGVLGFLGCAGLMFLGHVSLARKGLALISVIVFPTLSITYLLGEKTSGIVKTIWLFLKTTLLSLVGAVLVIGLLGDVSFMYTMDQFMGVKLAHLVPIVLLIFIFWFFKDPEKNPLKKLWKVLNYAITVKYVVMLAILGVILLVYMMRTGNENTAVSAWELVFRAKLGYLLDVRPRTKEFLIGHPFMILMFYLGYRDRYLPLLIIGIIGQVSIVNTFAHIHTPLFISLIRSFNGVWLGIILGLVLIGIYQLILKACNKWRLNRIDS